MQTQRNACVCDVISQRLRNTLSKIETIRGQGFVITFYKNLLVKTTFRITEIYDHILSYHLFDYYIIMTTYSL